MKTTLKASLVAIAVASAIGSAQGAGLGAINVFNGLGQPLRAEIQINASQQELKTLTARIASPEAFRQADIPLTPLVLNTRVSIDTRGSRPVVRLVSDQPVNEPFIGVLLELEWGDGQLVREYTLLFDPVDMGAPVTPPVAKGARPSMPVAQPAVAKAPAQVQTPAAAPAKQPVSGSSGQETQHTVQRGDTLGRIARNHLQEGITLEQMLVALHRDNPDAFERGNINRLRSGAILTVPSAETARAIDTNEARREIAAQAADFNAFRQRLAEAAASRGETPAAPAGQGSAGKIVPKVDDAASAATGDQVKVSSTVDGRKAGKGGDADAAKRALEEELVARDKALAEANERVALLEKNVRDLQQLIEIKNQSLATAEANTKTAPEPASPAVAPPVVETQPETPPATQPAPSVESPETAAAQTDSPPAALEEKPAPPPPPVQEETSPPVQKKAPPPPEPEPEPDFVDSLLEDPLLLGGGALAVGLLGAGAYMVVRRRRQAKEAEELGLLSQFPEESAGIFGVSGGENVDTMTQSGGLTTDFSQAALSAIDANESVDPVAEADVYIAYGRDAQAEEILLDALQVSPNRLPIYTKLLSIYAQRKSVKEFNALAAELNALTTGAGPEWESAVELGRQLDPSNPLYVEHNTDPFAPAVAQQAVSTQTTRISNIGNMGAAADGMIQSGSARQEESSPLPELETPRPTSLSSLDFSTTSGGTPTALAMNSPTPAVEPAAANLPEPDLEFETAKPMSLHQLKDTWATPGELNQFVDDSHDAPPLDLDFDLDLGVPETSHAPAKPDISPESSPPLTASPERAKGVRPGLQTVLNVSELDLDGPPTQPPDYMDIKETKGMTPPESWDLPLTAPGRPSLSDVPDEDVVDLEITNFSSPLDFHSDSSPDVSVPADSPDSVEQEVETKIELARAYEEMGDIEGAKELLDEVMSEGSPAQQAKAREIAARIG